MKEIVFNAKHHAQEENEALQKLVLDLANDKQTAARRLAALKSRYDQLAGKVRRPPPALRRHVGCGCCGFPGDPAARGSMPSQPGPGVMQSQ